MENINRNIKIGVWTSCLTLLTLALLLTTNPQSLSPILLVVPFILFFLILLLAGTYITAAITKADTLYLPRKSLVLTALVAAYPVTLLLLQSVGQLSTRDAITLTLLLIISGFYVSKSSFGT